MVIDQSEILTILRGKKPSSLVSQKMGFKTNVVYSWERKQRSMSWVQFVKFCEVVDRKFIEDFRLFFRIENDLKQSELVVAQLIGDCSNLEIAKILGIAKSKVSKWLHGKQEPSYQDIMMLASISGGQLAAFFMTQEKFSQLSKISSLKQIKIFFETYPKAILIWNIIDLESYKQGRVSESKMAQLCQLKLSELIEMLSKMESLHILKKSDSLWTHDHHSVCFIGTQDEQNKMMHYWLSESARKLMLKNASSPVSRYNIFTADHKAISEIQNATIDFLHKVGAIIESAQSRPQTSLLILTNLLIDFLV